MDYIIVIKRFFIFPITMSIYLQFKNLVLYFVLWVLNSGKILLFCS